MNSTLPPEADPAQPSERVRHGRPRSWGVRFSVLDGCVLLVGALAFSGLYSVGAELAWLVPFVLGHFFLFCNVFRVHRPPELIWTALFLVNFGGWWLGGNFSWAGVLAVQLPLTLAILIWVTLQPSYHGIYADRWNPKLKDYLEG